MSGIVIALVVIVIGGLVIGSLAFDAAASNDLSLARHVQNESIETYRQDASRRDRRAKRAQQVTASIGLCCVAGVVWSVYIFWLALKPDEDPSSTGAAIFVAAFGFVGLLVCLYQFKHFGLRRKAIRQINTEQSPE